MSKKDFLGFTNNFLTIVNTIGLQALNNVNSFLLIVLSAWEKKINYGFSFMKQHSTEIYFQDISIFKKNSIFNFYKLQKKCDILDNFAFYLFTFDSILMFFFTTAI